MAAPGVHLCPGPVQPDRPEYRRHCHRRQNAEALRILNQKVKDRELDKRYLAVIHGTMIPPQGTLRGQIFKDAVQNRVYVTTKPQPGSKTALTNYRTLQSRNGLSLVECELVTGRTHQIRAQFAHAGHPLLGDGKYGKLERDRTGAIRPCTPTA